MRVTEDTDSVARAEARLEQIAPGYLELVRSASAALAVSGRRPAGDLGSELVAVAEAASFDLDVPTVSSLPGGAHLKTAVKRATSWYLRYLTVQLAAFAAAVVAMGEALAERLEGDRAEMDAELDEIRQRVERLERSRLDEPEQGGGTSSPTIR